MMYVDIVVLELLAIVSYVPPDQAQHATQHSTPAPASQHEDTEDTGLIVTVNIFCFTKWWC